jgi:protein-tyrosine phosphatase
MIDLHSHILPGIDDGAPTLAVSLDMARQAVADGITTMACTPHIYPGLYPNTADSIQRARDVLQADLLANDIPLTLVTGADVHLVPGLLQDIRAGLVPTLNGTRYLLLEPSHHVAPPRFEETVFQLVAAGYTPVITHPERLTWIETHHDIFVNMIKQGAWMQVTAGALTGVFGKRAQYWGERLVGEGHTHILASDAHSASRRRPCLMEGLAVAERLLGKQEADHLVNGRPQSILDDAPPDAAAPLPAMKAPAQSLSSRFFNRWLK